MPRFTLTVAILTRNRLPQLKTAVEGLLRQRPAPDEILVADTGSNDGTREWVRSRGAAGAVENKTSKSAGLLSIDPTDPDDQKDPTNRTRPVDRPARSESRASVPPDPAIRLLEDSGRGAYAGARNRAVEASRGEVIAFLDDDCEPDTDWVRRILDRFTDDVALDVLGGVTLPARALDFPDWWPPEANWVLGLSGPGCWGPDAGRVDLGQTSNLAFRRRAWEAVKFGELGESDFAEGGAVYESGREDVDWWRRLRRMGWKAVLDGKLIAWHDIPQSRLDWKEALDRARRDGRSHWRRAGTRADARAAASDVAHAPVRFVSNIARRGITPAQAARQVRLWTARQAALLGAAGTSWEKPVSPEERTRFLLRETVRMGIGVGKWAARTTLAAGHHAFRHYRPIPTPNNPPKTLLLVSHDYLGDQFLIQPALRLLRETYPDTKLVFLTGRFGEELYGEGAPDADRRLVDRVVDAGRWNGLPLPRRHARLQSFIADLYPAAILVFYAHGLWPAPLFLTANTPVIGHDRDQGFNQKFWCDLLTVCVEKDWSIHEVLNHARLARVLGVEGELEPYTLTIPDEVQRKVDETLGGDFVVLNPGAGQRYKEWPARRWFQLAKWIETETPYEVVFTGGRAEGILTERFQSNGLRARNFCGWSLRPTAALFRRARLLITADSGPKHLAMAVRAPTLTLYGPTEEWRWAAFWDREIHHELRCGLPDLTPEDLRGLPENWTMRLIDVEDVLDTLGELLPLENATT